MRKFLLTILLAITLAAAPVMYAPVSTAAPPTVQTSGNPDARVWVNTGSGVYHCPGTRWYGKTKQGEYMTQKQAQEKKYRPAYGKVCQ